jgi:hypothetical protein
MNRTSTDESDQRAEFDRGSATQQNNPALAAAAVALELEGRLAGNRDRAERVYRAIRDTIPAGLKRLEVLSFRGLLVLEGSVASSRLKQIAQEAAESVPGPEAVWNRLKVEPPQREGEIEKQDV